LNQHSNSRSHIYPQERPRTVASGQGHNMAGRPPGASCRRCRETCQCQRAAESSFCRAPYRARLCRLRGSAGAGWWWGKQEARAAGYGIGSSEPADRHGTSAPCMRAQAKPRCSSSRSCARTRSLRTYVGVYVNTAVFCICDTYDISRRQPRGPTTPDPGPVFCWKWKLAKPRIDIGCARARCPLPGLGLICRSSLRCKKLNSHGHLNLAHYIACGYTKNCNAKWLYVAGGLSMFQLAGLFLASSS
jgi:hypothetical protein